MRIAKVVLSEFESDVIRRQSNALHCQLAQQIAGPEVFAIASLCAQYCLSDSLRAFTCGQPQRTKLRPSWHQCPLFANCLQFHHLGVIKQKPKKTSKPGTKPLTNRSWRLMYANPLDLIHLQQVMKKKPKKGAKPGTKPLTKLEPVPSFFSFFSPPEVPEEGAELTEDAIEALQEVMEEDYEMGCVPSSLRK